MSLLLEKLTNYGVDTETALARFGDDKELYERCFYMLLDDPNFKELGRSLAASDYQAAFYAAHTLKGMAGNLELPALYKTVSALAESLHAGTALTQQYDAVMREYEALTRLGR